MLITTNNIAVLQRLKLIGEIYFKDSAKAITININLKDIDKINSISPIALEEFFKAVLEIKKEIDHDN